jgi:hypothetical protein
MTTAKKQVMGALLRREIQEYRNSFVITPLVVAAVLIVSMLTSALFANRITVMGDTVMNMLHEERTGKGMQITISIDEEPAAQDYIIKQQPSGADIDEEEWNFSSEWTFTPERRAKTPEVEGTHKSSLNQVSNALHCIFLLLLLVTSVNYLLGTFHQDRRDGSVLFWKSMPVSEAREVAAKLAMVCLVAPAIYLLISMVAQLCTVALAMLTTWRMDMNPMQTVLGNIDFPSLFRGQLSGMLIWVAWTVPFYAWLLLCSAAARRSPLMLALGIPIALMLLETLFIGSDLAENAFSNHIPHPGTDGGAPLGFYFSEPLWSSLDYPGMLLGLLVAAGFLAGAAWFRKHRSEVI